ncbi:DUF427 domain-containing protein [Mycobacterium shimoidei]|nr:DUF427 domain-containing protein [Mycobacterium shimoidei]MCV7258662.1 DUF427 domain-containing protein [Mycobacterium shimoidei]ODR15411.1 hypothetical protein BHQ16_01375 [Mycobacterium shimoidei]ORW79987.1 hypothetical protein AWC26_13970 [Mycobacterium shimoidei]
MAIKMRDLLGDALGSLRYEPTEKRLRVYQSGQLVADTLDGRLVWQPGRLVPTYAIPERDVSARLDPGSAVRSDDPDLAGYLILDFNAFDWREEDEPIVAHPHDPFVRIDILSSTRPVRIEHDGRLLAESSQALLLFETRLPIRYYLPRADVVVDLEPSDTVSYCAYKGRASYLSVPDGPQDVAWTYPAPLPEAEPVRERVAFFNEKVDVIVDGQRQERPVTPWSS